MLWFIIILAMAGSLPDPTGPVSKARLPELRALAEQAGLSEDWVTFLSAVAHHESKWNPSVGLGLPGRVNIPGVTVREHGKLGKYEAAAALMAYDRHPERFEDCPWPRMRYGFGSGGWFGLLPANALASYMGNPEGICLDPQFSVFDPWSSVVLATDYARRLTKWKSFAAGGGTWKVLNRGWAAPGNMDGTPAERVARSDERWERALKALGIPSSWGNRRVAPLPSGWDAWSVYTAGLNKGSA